MRAYTKQAGYGLEMENQCAEIKLRAERKGGELLEKMADSGERPKGRRKESQDVTFSDLGVTTKQSSRWHAIASIPEGETVTNQSIGLTAVHETTLPILRRPR